MSAVGYLAAVYLGVVNRGGGEGNQRAAQALAGRRDRSWT